MLTIFPSPAWESLVSDIPAGERKIANLYLQCVGSNEAELSRPENPIFSRLFSCDGDMEYTWSAIQ